MRLPIKRVLMLLALGMAPLLSSCASSSDVVSDCVAPLPITVSPKDQLTDTTARQILTVDLWYKRYCQGKR